tara:strand:- start:17989 stop:19086 length:1098 start_codon:yes stop_codon:yes gene_type:complete
MLELQVRARLDAPHTAPFVIKVLGENEAAPVTAQPQELAFIRDQRDGEVEIDTHWGVLTLSGTDASFIGDVLFVDPISGIAQRWFRRGDTQNTLLITERCDQLCVMCSQPPKKSHTDYFAHFERACLLADANADIGLSGGEPTLFKDQIFSLVRNVVTRRADIRFHILTNAQHFQRSDIETLHALRGDIVWGVPVYSSNPATHDQLVGKLGAFERLEASLGLLYEANAAIEIRTVLMRQTIGGLGALARWLSARLCDANCWAIMQLEKQGFAKGRWDDQFFDHSTDFTAVGDAISMALAQGLDTLLYNVPRCTVPAEFRDLCPSTISDWKRDYRPECQACNAKSLCSGLFAWHGDTHPYAHWGTL